MVIFFIQVASGHADVIFFFDSSDVHVAGIFFVDAVGARLFHHEPVRLCRNFNLCMFGQLDGSGEVPFHSVSGIARRRYISQ